jgi:ATP-dependent Lon protease
VLVFPHIVVPLEVGRDKSISALDEAMQKDRILVLATQKESKQDDPSPEDLFDMGTLVQIKQVVKLPGGTVKVVVEGLERARIEEYLQSEPHFCVRVRPLLEDELPQTQEVEALMRSVVNRFEQYVRMSKKHQAEALVGLVGIDNPGRLADTIASQLPIRLEEKQEILSLGEPFRRLEKVNNILHREMELLELEKRINNRVRKQIEKSQREYFLREQMKAIQNELGDGEDQVSEIDEYREKIKQCGMPEEAAQKAMREVDRLQKMPTMSAEAVVVRTYLDWMVSLPWQVETEDHLDIERAETILDEDHYGLTKVKERISEYLAVRKLAKNMKGPILCLVGPPGVGKTSLAKSIARALERRFVRVSLGGMRDEAEIRGHRRTYVGALPGRIIQGIRQAGSRNPVFLLDEIDKLTSDFRGDPAAALLEVLDPEQNHNFSDHYIETPFDLSNVMFITTANSHYNIPRPLLDRMEVIHISSYTEEEKVEIGKRHLVPKQLQAHGLQAQRVRISEKTIREIVRRYTREAGVRNLERELAAICRKAAREIASNPEQTVRATVQNLPRFLGVPRYRYGLAEKESEVGVATGLSWTENGGDLLPIEVSLMKGSGKLILTGKLGEVMQESAQASLSYIRSRATRFGIDEEFYEKMDIHVHVPEGAIPKDGPSAGITMVTAIFSALTNRPVRHDVAMTGEVTLRGRILPIGGLKEKVLAAHRAGIQVVILPEENHKDLEDIPNSVKRRLQFVLVNNIDEVLENALAEPLPFAHGFHPTASQTSVTERMIS